MSNYFPHKKFFTTLLPQQDPEFVKQTFSSIAKRYDFANHLLSGGMDFLWRRKVAKLVTEKKPHRILDLATGSGDLARVLQQGCPSAFVVGADFCFPMLEEARKKNIRHLVQADALALPFRNGIFDAVTVAFGLRNMASWSGALREMARVLQPEGLLVVLDFSMPEQSLLRAAYRVYLHRILPAVARWATGHAEAYKYLGKSIEAFPRGSSMNALIESCGFACKPPRPLCLGIVTIYAGIKI